ncbi:STAS domain-containing protein [Spongiactinospora sp. TRM90649]|uniref:STAS domain-containing protein n=1 Tax=Spongiactinospora sp. TRM90649 TaxID=3031114 RepID=UPI0023F8B237|nr:STAS domain-containing protein [Spongiactinospora sp. TRM90649]MDF5754617.1 STAS domain-containing protein [Spongiactinospora sp. TRM90649]
MITIDRPRATVDGMRTGKSGPWAGAVPAGSCTAATTIHLSGEIDIFTSHALRQRLMRVLCYSTNLLILDLSEVSFCDASGLAVLVGIQRRARAMGITLALAAPRPYMSKLLRITGLDHSLRLVA